MKKLISIAITCSFLVAATGALAAFSDTKGHAYETAINWIQAQGIVKGYDDGTYRPNNNLNRAEFTKIILEAAGHDEASYTSCLANHSIPFSDVPKGAWFEKYVCLAHLLGVIGGYPDGTFKPGNNINFAEGAKIVVNALDLPAGAAGSEWWHPFVNGLAAANAIPQPTPNVSDLLTRGQMADIIYRILYSEGEMTDEEMKEMMEEEEQEQMEEELTDEEMKEMMEEEEGSTDGYFEFSDNVIGNGEDSILFFHAAWCPHCIHHDELLQKLEPADFGYSVYKVDYDTELDLRSEYEVTSQHTYVLINGDGKPLELLMGLSDEKLIQFVKGE